MNVTIFVPDLEEFWPVVDGARQAGCRIEDPVAGYWRIERDTEIRLRRKDMGLGRAIWNSCLIGGVIGTIAMFDQDELVVRPL